ncbi:MAG: RDD family protein [Arenimonas sp.]
MLDTTCDIQTPEGLALTLYPAGPVPRALAWLLDFVIRIFCIFILAIPLGMLGQAGSGILMIFMFLLYWAYPILFEVLRDGQTIGKKSMGLKVVNQNGTPITWVASIARNLLRAADMFPFFYGFGLASCLIDPHSRRLGDLVAGSLVVHVDRISARLPSPPIAAEHLAVLLKREEQGAIVNFSERALHMTQERQRELADILSPVTHLRGDDNVRKLLGVANGLLGRK